MDLEAQEQEQQPSHMVCDDRVVTLFKMLGCCSVLFCLGGWYVATRR